VSNITSERINALLELNMSPEEKVGLSESLNAIGDVSKREEVARLTLNILDRTNCTSEREWVVSTVKMLDLSPEEWDPVLENISKVGLGLNSGMDLASILYSVARPSFQGKKTKEVRSLAENKIQENMSREERLAILTTVAEGCSFEKKEFHIRNREEENPTLADPTLNLINYLIENQEIDPEKAKEVAKQIEVYIQANSSKIESGEPHYFFHSANTDLPRTIYISPTGSIFICFNRKNQNDKSSNGTRKKVYDAYDYKTGKVYARLVGFNDKEKKCVPLLEKVPGVIFTYEMHSYWSFKTKTRKDIAYQEKVEGGTLDNFINNNPTAQKRCAVVRTLLDTLAEIHRIGVFHNDLFSENILFDEKGQPKIIDFGRAEICDPTQPGVEYRNRLSDMRYMSEHIESLCPDIIKTPAGENFITEMRNNQLSARDALIKFNELMLSDPMLLSDQNRP